jgi:hypothetical protein
MSVEQILLFVVAGLLAVAGFWWIHRIAGGVGDN